MTEYVYELRTNTPVGAFTSIGNAPAILAASAYMGGVDTVGQGRTAVSNGAAQMDGHRFDLKLMELVPDVEEIADDMARVAQIELTDWQRDVLVRWLQAGEFRVVPRRRR